LSCLNALLGVDGTVRADVQGLVQSHDRKQEDGQRHQHFQQR
jgi:hypothetical protein